MLRGCVKYTDTISSWNRQGRAGGHLEFNRDKLMHLSAFAKGHKEFSVTSRRLFSFWVASRVSRSITRLVTWCC